MALEEILSRIVEEAKGEAGAIRLRGESEAQRVLDEAEKEAAALKRQIVEKGEGELRGKGEKALSRKRLEARREVLAAKKESLDELFRRLPLRLAERGAEEYAVFLASLVGDSLAGRPARIEVGARDVEKFGEGLAGLVAGELSRRFDGWEVEAVSRPGAFERGLVVRGGEVVHNLSLDALLAESRERMEVEVARVLFAETT